MPGAGVGVALVPALEVNSVAMRVEAKWLTCPLTESTP